MMQFEFKLKPTAAAVMLSGLLLAGCLGGGGGSDSSKTQGTVNGVTFKINSAAEIAQESGNRPVADTLCLGNVRC